MSDDLDRTPEERRVLALSEDFDRKTFIGEFLIHHPGADRNRVDASLDVAAAAITPGATRDDLTAAVEKLLDLP